MSYITFEDGIVTIDDKELPGLLVDMTVGAQVKFDTAKTDGQSGTKKTPMGYDDATIRLVIDLVTDDPGGSDCYQKLETINAMFKDVGPKAAPKILTVVNRHMRARKINQVVFSGLVSRETNRDDVIRATLNFEEHNPPIIKTEQRVVGQTLEEQKNKAEEEKKNSAPPANPSKVIKVEVN